MVDIINNYRYFRGILEVKLITGCGFFDFGFGISDCKKRLGQIRVACYGGALRVADSKISGFALALMIGRIICIY